VDEGETGMDDPEIPEGVALLLLPERRKAEGMFTVR